PASAISRPGSSEAFSPEGAGPTCRSFAKAVPGFLAWPKRSTRSGSCTRSVSSRTSSSAGCAAGTSGLSTLSLSSSAMIRRIEARISSMEGCSCPPWAIANSTLPARAGAPACRSSRLNLFVRQAQAVPGVFDCLVIPLWIIDRHIQPKISSSQAPNRREEPITLNHLIAPSAHQIDLCIEQFLLLIQQVEDGAGSYRNFIANAFERDLRCADLCVQRTNLSPG